ncbi:MAG: hypothetical protein IJK71_13435 [Clostridia bacterium]|nr:hypothetical protein [Clostridia bacterium]
MKRFFSIALACLILALLTLGSVQAEESNAALSNYGYLSSTNANFRSMPNTKSERIAKLEKYALMKCSCTVRKQATENKR